MPEWWDLMDGDVFGLWVLGALIVGILVEWISSKASEPKPPEWKYPPTRTEYSESRVDWGPLDSAVERLKGGDHE